MRITLTQLRYVCAISDHLHFSKAAKACHVTQSTLSAGVVSFEESIGQKIFERTNKQVLVTDLGRTIIDKARHILNEINGIEALGAASGEPLSGKLILGAIPTIGPFLFPNWLPELRARYPNLKLYLKERQTEPLLTDLSKGLLDAAILAFPYPIKNMRIGTAFKERFIFACSTNHPLAGEEKVKTSQIDHRELLLLEEGNCIRDHALAACRLSKQKHAPFEGTSLPTLIEMVANNLGVTLVPEMALSSELFNQPKVHFIPFEDPGVSRSIALVWRQGSLKHNDLELLAEDLMHTLVSCNSIA